MSQDSKTPSAKRLNADLIIGIVSLGLAALVLVRFTLLSTTPVMLALVQEHAGSSPSAANGFFIMISFIARSAVVVVVGFVGDQIGLKSTYFVSAFLGLAAVPFVLKLPRE